MIPPLPTPDGVEEFCRCPPWLESTWGYLQSRVQRIRTSARSGVLRLRHRVRTCSTSSIFTGLTT